jgi:hypothetical protein
MPGSVITSGVTVMNKTHKSFIYVILKFKKQRKEKKDEVKK